MTFNDVDEMLKKDGGFVLNFVLPFFYLWTMTLYEIIRSYMT